MEKVDLEAEGKKVLQHTYTLINNRDYQAAVDHIIAVAEFTTNQAWIFLANALNSGTDVEARPEEALRILSELANTGDSEGQMTLGWLFGLPPIL